MRLGIGILVLFVIWCLGFGVYASVLTLDEAVQTALKQNPEIQSSRSKWQASGASVPKSYWLPDPKLGVDFEGIPEGSADVRQAMMRYYNFIQEIPWPGMLMAEGGAAAARAEMLKYSYFATEREVLRKVKTAYYEISKIDELIRIVTESAAAARQAYKTSQANYSAGKISQVEVIKMQIELNRMENELANMKDERSIKEVEFGLLLNTSTEEPLAVAPLPKKTAEGLAYRKVVEIALEKSPRIKMEESSVGEARAMAASARSAYFPESMVKWRSQKAGPSVGSNDLMLEFSVPLWFSFRQMRQVEETDKNVSAREANLAAMKNMVRREIKDHFTMLGIYQRKLKLYDASLLASSSSALEGSLAGYRSGQVEFLMLIDSIRSYLDINKDYYETLAGYHIKLAELDEIVGRDL